MIALALCGVALAAEPGLTLARAGYLRAAWAQAHGDIDGASRAATTVLLHDADAAAPRALLASLQPDEPLGNEARLRWLEDASTNPAADHRVWTALGAARSRLGQHGPADAAFAEAERRGGGGANYSAWLAALHRWERFPLDGRAGDVSDRWAALAEPGPGGSAQRATGSESTAPGAYGQRCADALDASLLGEPLAPRTAALVCGKAGRIATGRRILDRLAPGWPAAALTEARAVLQAAMEGNADEGSALRLAGLPAVGEPDAGLCPWVLDRWPDDARLRARCVTIGGWPR
ncbi:MAG: hypothetical protein EXR71_18985 [Myxococcales bacterium]|nr:hypothetical protein [Myxococcales bacterium]